MIAAPIHAAAPVASSLRVVAPVASSLHAAPPLDNPFGLSLVGLSSSLDEAFDRVLHAPDCEMSVVAIEDAVLHLQSQFAIMEVPWHALKELWRHLEDPDGQEPVDNNRHQEKPFS